MLVDQLGPYVAGAESFRLSGGAGWLLTSDDVLAAADRLREAREQVPAGLRDAWHAEERRLALLAHAWDAKYNRSVGERLQGYLKLGRLCRFEYPWPVVAILGILQVQSGMTQMQMMGLWGSVRARLGNDRTARTADRVTDVLRRTNRGIFLDSVPTVLRALRIHDLRASDAALADVLLTGPLPPLFDEESRAIMRSVVDGLAVSDGAARFERLAAVTLQHFDREQAIFTHQMGADRQRPPKPGPSPANQPRSVSAPRIEGSRLAFRSYALPEGFDMRDHAARVEHFGSAFVRSVTGSRDDYLVAVEHIVLVLGGDASDVQWPKGGARRTLSEDWEV